jgi:serine/threonine protein kinase
VFEYCGNGSLSGLIADTKGLPPKIAKIYAAQILSVLDHIHRKNVKHRDFKPENIMLDESYNIKIVS